MAKKQGKVRSWWGSLSMRVKVNAALLFTILAVLITGELIYETRYRKDETENITKYYRAVTQNYVMTMESLMDKVLSASSLPLYSDEIKETLRTDSVSTEAFKRLMSFSMRVMDVNSMAYEYGIGLYGKTGRLQYSWIRPRYSYVLLENFDMWMEMGESFHGATSYRAFDDGTGEFAMAVIKLIRMPSTLETIGLMVITVPTDVIAGAGGESPGSPFVSVYDSVGELIYTNSERPVPSELCAYMSDARPGTDSTIQTERYLGHCFKHQEEKYSIIVYEETDVIFEPIRRTGNMFRAISAVIGAAAILCAGLFSRQLTRPLMRLTTLMHRVESGDRSVRFHARYTDEVGLLADSFDHMLDQLDEMVNKVVETETLRKQTEIDALKGQIAPHFMYNCLENFQMMAVENDNFELSRLIAKFGRLIRYNISSMNEMTTLRNEIEYLKLYVTIQNSRRVKPVKMEVFIEDGLENTGIIKLALQPVVENAIQHGLEGCYEEDAGIRIDATRENHQCIIRITDNGIGMTPDKLEEVRRHIQTDYMRADTSSIGLRNANTRIKLYYGEKWGITIDSKENAGTCITVSIPAGKEKA